MASVLVRIRPRSHFFLNDPRAAPDFGELPGDPRPTSCAVELTPKSVRRPAGCYGVGVGRALGGAERRASGGRDAGEPPSGEAPAPERSHREGERPCCQSAAGRAE